MGVMFRRSRRVATELTPEQAPLAFVAGQFQEALHLLRHTGRFHDVVAIQHTKQLVVGSPDAGLLGSRVAGGVATILLLFAVVVATVIVVDRQPRTQFDSAIAGVSSAPGYPVR